MSYKTMKQSQDWKKNYNWTDKNDHPVEDNQFKPKVLKDQLVKFYKKPKKTKWGISYGVIELDKPLFPINKEVANDNS